MRSFAEFYMSDDFVQQSASQIPWFHNCLILEIDRALFDLQDLLLPFLHFSISQPPIDLHLFCRISILIGLNRLTK